MEQEKINKEEAQKMLNTLTELDNVLGVIFPYLKNQKKEIPNELKELLKMREIAREEGDFIRADEIRDEIEKKGFVVKDTSEGQEVLPK
jgi:cysteinyl-tRNA synthetase